MVIVLRDMSVQSIGALFHTQPATIPAETKTSLHCRSSIAIVIDLLKKSSGSVRRLIPHDFTW